MKKSILLFIAIIAISLNSLGQDMEAYYNFAYAPSDRTETLYITSIISERFKTGYIGTATGFNNQWHDKFKADCGEEYYKYRIDTWLWDNDIREVEKKRNKEISYYKERGYKIIYVNDFKYYKD